jgi:hypothetical protein
MMQRMDWSKAKMPVGKRPDPPAPRLMRHLWTVRKSEPDRSITAGVYRNPYGRELRIHWGERPDNLLDSLLSRTDDAPLEFRANELRAVLLEQGWTAADAGEDSR